MSYDIGHVWFNELDIMQDWGCLMKSTGRFTSGTVSSDCDKNSREFKPFYNLGPKVKWVTYQSPASSFAIKL